MRAPSIAAFVRHFEQCKEPPRDSTGTFEADDYCATVAAKLRRLIHAGNFMEALQYYDKAVGNHGIEYISESDDVYCNGGIEYSNTGDTYAETLCWDRTTGSIRLCSWGDIVERNPRRFRD